MPAGGAHERVRTPLDGLRRRFRSSDLWFIALAARDRAPFRLTHYAQDLASLFHQFYTNCHVLTDDADVQTARLALCDATRIVLALTLNLLGVSAPVKM